MGKCCRTVTCRFYPSSSHSLEKTYISLAKQYFELQKLDFKSRRRSASRLAEIAALLQPFHRCPNLNQCFLTLSQMNILPRTFHSGGSGSRNVDVFEYAILPLFIRFQAWDLVYGRKRIQLLETLFGMVSCILTAISCINPGDQIRIELPFSDAPWPSFEDSAFAQEWRANLDRVQTDRTPKSYLCFGCREHPSYEIPAKPKKEGPKVGDVSKQSKKRKSKKERRVKEELSEIGNATIADSELPLGTKFESVSTVAIQPPMQSFAQIVKRGCQVSNNETILEDPSLTSCEPGVANLTSYLEECATDQLPIDAEPTESKLSYFEEWLSEDDEYDDFLPRKSSYFCLKMDLAHIATDLRRS